MREEIEEMIEVSEFEEINDDNGLFAATTPPWQDEILDNCRRWLEDIQEEPDIAGTEEQPDLYSFYEELCVLRNEFRKNSRRSHETFHQFGEQLGDFKGVMTSLAQRLENLTREQESTEILARQEILLQIVEIHERMLRFDEKLQEMNREHLVPGCPPGLWKRLLGRDWDKQMDQTERQEKQGIHADLREGFFLIMFHFDEFLARLGVRRTATRGTPFDPSIMIAVAAVATDACPPHTVLEEISGGYLYGDHVLKLAQVTVSKQKEQ